MAYFRKRGDKWSAEVRMNGKSISKRFDSKKLARQWASIMETQANDDDSPKIIEMTLSEALHRYACEYTDKKKSFKTEFNRIKKMQKWDIAQQKLHDIRLQDLNKLRDNLLLRLSPASVTKELSIIKVVFKTAQIQWEIIENNPCTHFKLPKEQPPRFRRISDHEIDRILSALFYDEKRTMSSTKDEVAIAFLLALETAMRQGEIWGLEWQHIKLRHKYLTLYDTKNGDKRDVPLSTRAIELLSKLRGRSDKQVFKSHQETAAITFRRALKLAGIENLRFHDTRHEAITRLARKLDVLDLARMIGHRDPRSLMIYYNPTATEIADRLG